jgi:hypothetical protein
VKQHFVGVEHSQQDKDVRKSNSELTGPTPIMKFRARIDMLYTDRLDGRITLSFYDAKAGEFRAQQQAILRQIEQIQATAPVPVEGALDLMRLTSKAATLFCQQNGHEQRRLLRTLMKSAAWQGGELRLEFEEPFEILRGSNRANRTKDMQIPGSGRDSEIWLDLVRRTLHRFGYTTRATQRIACTC